MCTSIAMLTNDFYFGRNMDIYYKFGEHVVVTPRNFSFKFRRAGTMTRHLAMIGMAAVQEGYPLYAEAVNEKGLGMAGLLFEGNAFYPDTLDNSKSNVSPFELIPWIVGKCSTVEEAKKLLSATHITNIPFSEDLPLTQLHWHIADRNSSIVVESMKDGLKIYDNPVGVMTNNPQFEYQLENLGNYLNLTVDAPQNIFSEKAGVTPFSNGQGSFGLPGDFSSSSRFVKAAYLKLNSVCKDSENDSISQFFHILNSVSVPNGCVRLPQDNFNVTTYTCCVNADKGIFYYNTYHNSQITAVDMRREDLNNDGLSEFPLVTEQQILQLN